MKSLVRDCVVEYAKQALTAVRSIMQGSRSGSINEQCWDDLNLVVAALPTAADEYGQIVNRLRNVRKYLAEDEVGAALFELRLLESRIKTYAESASTRF